MRARTRGHTITRGQWQRRRALLARLAAERKRVAGARGVGRPVHLPRHGRDAEKVAARRKRNVR